METVFECEFTPTVKMIANRIRKYNPGRCIIMLLLGVGIFAYIFPVALIYQFYGVWAVFFLFSIAYLLYGVFMPEVNAYFSLRRFKKDASGDGVYRITFGDAIEVRQGNIRVYWDYSEISEVLRLKYTYELKKSKRMALMVVPNGFTKGTFEAFKQFLREKRPDLNIPE